MTNSQWMPAIIAPLLVWRFYRRFRRNIGRQRFRPNRAIFVIALFGVLFAVFGVLTAKHLDLLSALLGGTLGGGIVGLVGLKFTRCEKISDDEHFYTPNPYLGVAISMLLVGRLAYRFAILYSATEHLEDRPSGMKPSLGQSPLTMVLFGFTLGYYLVYNLGLLLKFGRDKAVTTEPGGGGER